MITLLQINTAFIPTVFTPYRSGVWNINLYGVESFLYGTVWGTFEGMAQLRPSRIGQLRFGLEYMVEVKTEQEVFDNPGTYYYFKDEYRVIVNIAENGHGWQVPFGKLLEVGIISGFSDRVDYKREDQAYYNDIYYKPCISSIPDFSQKRDRMFFGVNSYTAISITMLNHDGFFDNFHALGAVVSMYCLEDGADLVSSDLRQKGVITDYDRGNQKAVIKIGDQRLSFDRNINLGKINPTNYPYLYDVDEEDDGDYKIKPIAIGPISNYKPVCVDKGNKSVATASYLLCAPAGSYTMKGVKNAWVTKTDSDSKQYDLIIPAGGETISDPQPLSDDSEYAMVSDSCFYAIDAESGLLTVSVREGIVCETSVISSETSYSWEDLNINMFGLYNKNPDEDDNLSGIDLIRIGYEIFGGLAYREWNFDLLNFAQERERSLLVKRPVSMLIDEDMTINEYIKKICEATDIVTTSRGDGRIAALVLDGKSRGIKAEIPYYDLFDREDNGVESLSEILSTVKIEYGEAGDNENKKTLTDDSKEIFVQQKYHVTKDSTFNTVLAGSTGAQLKATAILQEAISPTNKSDKEIPYTPEYASLDHIDTIVAPAGRGNTKRAVYVITSVKKSRTKNRISLVLEKKADVKYDYGYTQGFAYGLAVYGVHPYGISTHDL